MGLSTESGTNADVVYKSRLFDNIMSLYLLQGLNYLIPMAVLPYLVRVLGMDIYGLVAFSQAFAQYFVILTDYGFNLSATRTIAEHRGDKRAIRDTFLNVFLIKLSLMILGFAVLSVIVFIVPRIHRDFPYFLWAYLGVVGNVLFPQWYFQGIERMRYISAFTGTAKIVSAALLFLFVHGPADGLWAVAIQSGGMLIAGVMGLFAALHAIGLAFEWPSMTSIRTTLIDGWHLFVAMASVSLYSNTNIFLVGLLAGNVEAGCFSVADKLIRAMLGVIGPITQAIYPRISTLATDSREAALRLASKSLFWMAGFTLLISISTFVLARPVTLFLFGTGALQSVPVIRWIAFLPFVIAVSNALGVQTMLTFGLDRQFSRILLVSGILNVSIGIPLVYLFKAQGGGMAVFFTEIFVTVTMAIVLNKHNINIILPRSFAA